MGTLGENIKFRREAMRLSQRDLASLLDVQHVAVSKWESGSMYPTADRIPKIADALGCTIDALYGRSDEKRPAS